MILLLLGALLVLSVKAFASTIPGPTFTTAPAVAVTDARFAIPEGGTGTWTLRVWSHGQLIGFSRGTSGVLTVPVPATQACNFQADIRTTRPGGSFRYVTGKRILAACCPPGTASSGLTTSASPS